MPAKRFYLDFTGEHSPTLVQVNEDGAKIKLTRGDSHVQLKEIINTHNLMLEDSAAWHSHVSGDPNPPMPSGLFVEPKGRQNKYARTIKGAQVDFYDIARAFEITDPAIQHALKKLLRYGKGSGGKTLAQDVDEAIFSLERWKQDQPKDKQVSEPK